MAGFSGDLAILNQVHGKLVDTQNDLQGNFSQLANDMAAVSSGWAGQGAQAFQKLADRYNEAVDRLNKALMGINELFEQAGAEYTKQQAETEDMFSGGGFKDL